jgi:uncharacterized membrane protein YfcA
MLVILVGFLIGNGVGLTGVGAGALMAPILMLFFKVSPVQAVGTALAFSAVIKMTAAPIYIVRKQVHLPTLIRLAIGGIPGVLAGFYFMDLLDAKNHRSMLFLIMGGLLSTMSIYNLYRTLSKKAHERALIDRSKYLPWVGLGIGAGVGFSSTGAGALGGVALLNLTPLSPARVVGTDVMFGLTLSVIGGSFFHLHSHGNYHEAILIRLIIGGVVGVLIGASLLSVLPSRPLRVALSAWLTFMGAQLCWQAF